MPSFDLPGRDGQAERTDFRWLMMSDVCKHCTHAACLDVCPTGALFRTEFGTVVVQEDICNGCGYCVSACPYGVIDRREDDGRVSCDDGRACCRRPAAGSRGFQPAGRADGRWPRRPVTACRPRLRRRLATP
ncbi:MAG TPA: 4Fe-4S dicluster domain-containing protein [Kribbellaceae bacterium]|nr:4Fe-4S dicluster domain-containing protein [Kribbellaceae bacterium]